MPVTSPDLWAVESRGRRRFASGAALEFVACGWWRAPRDCHNVAVAALRSREARNETKRNETQRIICLLMACPVARTPGAHILNSKRSRASLRLRLSAPPSLSGSAERTLTLRRRPDFTSLHFFWMRRRDFLGFSHLTKRSLISPISLADDLNFLNYNRICNFSALSIAPAGATTKHCTLHIQYEATAPSRTAQDWLTRRQQTLSSWLPPCFLTSTARCSSLPHNQHTSVRRYFSALN